jgi:hypothetical protein
VYEGKARRKAKSEGSFFADQASGFSFLGVACVLWRGRERGLRLRTPFFFLSLRVSLGPDRFGSRSVPSLFSSQREKREHEEQEEEQAQTPHYAPELFFRAFSET